MTQNAQVGPITGFTVKTITVMPGKGEEDVGKVKIVLEASKEELRAMDHDLTSILGALTMHQSTGETVGVQVRFGA